jgi:flagellar hook-length control protein FliK
MSQINMLAIDLAKNVDSQASSTKNSKNDDTQTSLFSDVMAKHQDHESGNNSQQSGNVNHEKTTSENSSRDQSTIKGADTDDKKPSDDSTSVENNGVKQAENNDDETSQTETQNGEVDYEGRDAILADKNNTEPSKTTDDIAKKLLSFILASDEVSTDHIDTKKIDEDKVSAEGEKVISINVTGKLNLSEGKTDKIISQDESTTNKVSDKAVSAELNGEQVESSEDASEVKNSLNKANQPITESSDSKNTPANLALSTTAKSVKEAILVNNSLEAEDLATSRESTLKTTAADASILSPINAENIGVRNIDDVISDKTGSETTLRKSLVLDKLTQEGKQSIKLNAEKSDNIQSLTQTSSAIDPKVAEVSVEEMKNSIKNDQSLDRVINQGTATNRLSSDSNQSNLQQGQQQAQQQNQQSAEHSHTFSKSESEQVKETLQVFAKNEQETDFSEKVTANVTEKSALQTSINETVNHQLLSQQSLSYAEDQAIQNNIAKAAADSMSVQSAKTAFNIQVETVAINRKDFADAVKDKVMVMINQKIKQLEIRLDPPELGSMHVKLNLQNEQAAVSFVVQNQQAKEALEQNMDKLKDMLAQSGVDVGDANIEQRNQQTDEGQESAQQKGSRSGLDGHDSLEDEMTMSGANLYKASASGVDYYA